MKEIFGDNKIMYQFSEVSKRIRFDAFQTIRPSIGQAV